MRNSEISWQEEMSEMTETWRRATRGMINAASPQTSEKPDRLRYAKFTSADEAEIEKIKSGINFMSFTHTSERCAEWGAMQMLYHKNKQLHDYLSSKLYSIEKRLEECDTNHDSEEYCKLLAEAELVKLIISETE